MEAQYQHTLEGEEVNEDDINLVAETAALADDRVLAELLRLEPAEDAGFLGTIAFRGIIPYGFSNGVTNPSLATVVPSGNADATVKINPFRAVIGSRSLPAAGALANWRDIRSAPATGTTTLAQSQQLAATISNNRWDLIYARVDIDVADPTVTRYVKDVSDVVSAQSVAVVKRTKVTIGVVQGVEGATPARPTVPSDSGSAYYIPLAYVGLQHPHTLVSAIPATRIDDVATNLSIARALGVPRVMPASEPSFPSAWATPNGRPNPKISKAMVGAEKRFFPLPYGSLSSYALNTPFVLDDTVDWRKRYFETKIQVAADTTSDYATFGAVQSFPSRTSVPTADPLLSTSVPHIEMGQSLAPDWDPGSSGTPTRALIAVIGGSTVTFTRGTATTGTLAAARQSSLMAANSLFVLYVDMTTGFLMGLKNATNAGVNMFFIVEATGQFANAY